MAGDRLHGGVVNLGRVAMERSCIQRASIQGCVVVWWGGGQKRLGVSQL